MAEVNPGAGAPNPADPNANPSSAGASDPANAKPPVKEEILADLVKHKNRARELEAENIKLKGDQEAARIARMKEGEQWKELATKYENDAKTAQAEAQRIKESFLGMQKSSAVKNEAVKLGIRKEAMADLDLLSLDDVTIETTSTGKINVLGADSFAEKIKAMKPHWFGGQGAPGVNTTNPGTSTDGTGPVTVAQVLAAEKEAMKTGDRTKYTQLHNKFREQQKAARS